MIDKVLKITVITFLSMSGWQLKTGGQLVDGIP